MPSGEQRPLADERQVETNQNKTNQRNKNKNSNELSCQDCLSTNWACNWCSTENVCLFNTNRCERPTSAQRAGGEPTAAAAGANNGQHSASNAISQVQQCPNFNAAAHQLKLQLQQELQFQQQQQQQLASSSPATPTDILISDASEPSSRANLFGGQNSLVASSKVSHSFERHPAEERAGSWQTLANFARELRDTMARAPVPHCNGSIIATSILALTQNSNRKLEKVSAQKWRNTRASRARGPELSS